MECNHGGLNQSQKLCVERVPIFSHLDKEEMLEISRIAVSERFKKGDRIFLTGEVSEKLFIIHKGKVKVSRVSESGREQILRILEPGDFMGELSLFGHSVLTSSAEAIEPTEVCLFYGSEMKQLVLKFPNIALQFLEQFSERLERAEGLIESLGLQDVEQRVASILLQLAENQNNGELDDNKADLTLSISKRDLASLIGTTQETLSRKLSAFQEQGWIKLIGQRRILILDKRSLEIFK